ncbi:Uma2 family endonuclease [Roseofilum sp. Guam]|uniref:Uma2 family endonuclease n=1 Tax=Roseofilum sp. Guam TaxID=2821502 RepID=UPI001B296BD8|nr:Uma2 family endonuclease [Roseofilum sp. Guam]MBP0030808.1 Uma2 family endonuclease [Roseofilum sp. Guam]
MVTTKPPPTEQPVIPGGKVILNGVSWLTFTALLAEVGENRACRFTYDRGVLEIRMPLEEHEEPKRLIENFVEVLVDELEIELRSLGSLSLKREDLNRFIEPATCFYIQSEALVRGRSINLDEVPPPDLAVESDYTHSSMNKASIYATLGVPELWRYTKELLEVYQLIDGEYQKSDKSLAFPFLPVDEIPGFIEQSKEIGQRSAVRLFRQIIREILD